VKYANAALVPLQNATLTIKDFGGITVATTTTNTSGVYTFTDVLPGNYRMTIVPTQVWGGCNATDALGILNHFVQNSLLTGMKLAAADVNNSHSVNATDAFFVMSRQTGFITSFAAGDYLYHTDTMYVNGSQVTNNFEMLCFGDVNASYLQPTKNGSAVSLVHQGNLAIPSYSEFSLPVKIITGAEVSAISLGFYYPEEYLEIIGTEVSHPNSSMYFSASNGLINMAWADLNPIYAVDGQTIVTLRLKTKDLSGLQGNIALELYPLSEFADSKANVINGVSLEIPLIQSAMQGINDPAAGFALSVYPNPVEDKSTIEFGLMKESRVKIMVYNVIGNMVDLMTDAVYPSGNHQLKLDGSTLTPGIYLLKTEITDHDQTYSKTIKVVVSN
jgi:hypothetical protein